MLSKSLFPQHLMAINVGKTMPCLPSPSHHHFYRWYGYRSQSLVVYDIVLPTLLDLYPI